VWEFKQIKDLYLRIVASRNVFIKFIHEVQCATRLPAERTHEVYKVYYRFKRFQIEWRSRDGVEELKSLI